MTQPVPFWVQQQLAGGAGYTPYDPSAMVSQAGVSGGVALDPATQAAIQQAYSGALSTRPQVPTGGITEQQYLEQAAAEERAKAYQPTPLPPALQGVTPFGQPQAPQQAPAQPVQPTEAAQPQQPEIGNLGTLAGLYARGNQSVIPDGVRKAAEQYKQVVPAAMPGQEQAYEAARQTKEEAENEALLDKRLALMQQADRDEELARVEYLRGRGYADEIVQNEQEKEARNAAIDSHVRELDSLVNQHTAELARNPVKEYWSSMGAGERIMNAVALGLGAAGQALAGGTNVALELVKAEIDGEVARQRAMVETLGHKIHGKRLIMSAMLEKFKDPIAAANASRSAMLGLVESAYRRRAALEQSAERKNQMVDLANQVAIEREQSKLNALGGEKTTLYAWQPARVTGFGGGLAGLTKMAQDLKLSPEQERAMKIAYVKEGQEGADKYLGSIGLSTKFENRNDREQARFDLEHKVFLSDGSIGYVRDKGDYEKTMTSLDTMTNNLGRLRKYALSGSPWSPTDRANVDAIASMAMGEIRTLLGLGVMSESDKELAAKLTGDFVNNRIGLADKQARLDTLQSLVEQKRRIYQERVTRDPNSNFKAEPQIVTRQAK